MFNEIPYETIKYETIKYLPIKDILELCKSNKIYNKICKDNILWIYLLKREYQIDYEGENAYMKFKTIYNREFLSNYKVKSIYDQYVDKDNENFWKYLVDRYYPDSDFVLEEIANLTINPFAITYKEKFLLLEQYGNLYWDIKIGVIQEKILDVEEKLIYDTIKYYIETRIRYMLQNIKNKKIRTILDENFMDQGFINYLIRIFPQKFYFDVSKFGSDYDPFLYWITNEYYDYLEELYDEDLTEGFF